MTRKAFRFLKLAALLLASGILVQTLHASSPPAGTKRAAITAGKAATKKSHKKHLSRKYKKRHAHKSLKAKGKRVSKEKALTVLREYLPEYADLHEAKTAGSSIPFLPVPDNFDTRSPFANSSLRYDLVKNIDTWLGTRYRFGGSSKRGIDCSGFTSAVMSATLKQAFLGSSRVQAQRFVPIFNTDSLQFGDMVFFTGRSKRADRIGHVAIFLGNGVFAHSSTGRGVLYSHISEGYYTARFRWGGRFLSSHYVTAQAEVGTN
jgi:cell wall-associated NlpC family hydrolase